MLVVKLIFPTRRRRLCACTLALLVGCGSRAGLGTGGDGSEDLGMLGAGATPATSGVEGADSPGAGAAPATGGPKCYIGVGGDLPTTGCQSNVGSTKAGTGTSTGAESPGGARWYIEGSVDGVPRYFEDDDALPGVSLLSRFSLEGAQLWLAEEREAMLRLPFSEGVEFICFSIESERVGDALSFSSGQLSRLDCDSGEHAPLYVSFDGEGGAARLDYLRETAEAGPASGFCNADGCEIEFQGRMNDTWVIWLDTWVAPGGSAEFTQSALEHYYDGSLSGACGGGGTITVSEDYSVEIAIDSMGALQSCPGESIDGALQGLVPRSKLL